MTINTKTKSDIDNYELLQEKLDKYILDVDKHLVQWYQIKSKRPRRTYKILSFLGITFATLTPPVIFFSQTGGIIISSLTALITIWIQYFRWGKVWQDYKIAQLNLETLLNRVKAKSDILKIENLSNNEKFEKLKKIFTELIQKVDECKLSETDHFFKNIRESENLLKKFVSSKLK